MNAATLTETLQMAVWVLVAETALLSWWVAHLVKMRFAYVFLVLIFYFVSGVAILLGSSWLLASVLS